ncbi:MAG: glutamate racemase [Bacilli bacterium]|nr:glutamate racemase [Bacilli bacterium]
MIGLIDSGIGGATVLKEIRKVIPKAHYLYYSDSLNNPYGEKTEEEIYIIVKNIVDFLLLKGCKIIVLACNTASGVCVERLRQDYKDTTFLAIEPAIKIVSDQKETGLTLVLATPRTLQTKKFLDNYQKYKPINCELVPCTGLAALIEEDKDVEITNYIKNIHDKYPDAENFVLGCTHYPLIQDKIKDSFPNAKFYDGSKGLSEELERKLKNEGNESQKEKIEFYDSSNSELKKERFFKFLLK